MKRLLIINYHFQERENVGSVRMRGLFKYLQSHGWEVVVLSGTPGITPEGNVIEVIVPDIGKKWRQFLGFQEEKTVRERLVKPAEKEESPPSSFFFYVWEEIFSYPDPVRTWIGPAVGKGRDLLKNHGFSAIISTSPPATPHIVAARLASEFSLPWIADFRDLWTQNHYFQHSGVRKFFERRLELRTLSNADVLTTVSLPLADKLKELHKNKRVLAIPNGFDPEQVNQGTPLSTRFTITYTGYLYRGRRDPEPLFKVIRSLIDENAIDPASVHIDFYGSDEGWLIHDVKKYQLEDIVKIHGIVSRDESIVKQRQSQILLLLTWNDPEEKGVYTGKLFDYLAARRPILSLGYTDGGVVKELLDQTRAGVHCEDETELREYLLNAYREYRELGAVQYHGIEEEIKKYSHVEMAGKFAEVLEEVTSGKTQPAHMDSQVGEVRIKT